MCSDVLLTEIDDLHREEHWHLSPDDRCFHVREYISHGGWHAGETNNLISNLKKGLDQRGKPGWRFKAKAIQQAGAELRGAISRRWLNGAAIVPMPPSKAKTHPEYDDRVLQIAKIICMSTNAAVRELLIQTRSMTAFHSTEEKRKIQALANAWEIDEDLAEPEPEKIGIIDDVITTGAHFVAAKRVLGERFPDAQIVGFFVARHTFAKEGEADAD